MDIIKTIYEQIKDRLEDQVPAIRFIDLDMQQFELYERPPVSFPCALIDIAGIEKKSAEDFQANWASVTVSVRFGFEVMEASNNLVPVASRANAFAHSTILDNAIRAINGYEFENSVAFENTGYRLEPVQGYKVYSAFFNLTLFAL